MRLNSVFNFVQLLNELANHNWETYPYIILTGPDCSGKSTVHSETLRSLKCRGLTLGIDAKEITVEGQLVSRVLSCAAEDELVPSRVLLQSTRTQVVIANSSLNHSRLKVRNRRWWRGRPASAREDEFDTGAQVSVLISDIIAVDREVFVVVDHWGDAEPFLRSFIGDLAQRLGALGNLRLMLVCDTTNASDDPMGGTRPIHYNVPKLDWEAIQLWGRQLNLRVSEANARMLHSLSKNGCAGIVRTHLMALFEDSDWQYASQSPGAS